MLNEERFFRVLVLTVLFSFFLYSLSWILLIFLNALATLLTNTFLESFVSMSYLILHLVLVILKYTNSIFFIGGIIGLIVIFINDWLVNPTRK